MSILPGFSFSKGRNTTGITIGSGSSKLTLQQTCKHTPHLLCACDEGTHRDGPGLSFIASSAMKLAYSGPVLSFCIVLPCFALSSFLIDMQLIPHGYSCLSPPFLLPQRDSQAQRSMARPLKH